MSKKKKNVILKNGGVGSPRNSSGHGGGVGSPGNGIGSPGSSSVGSPIITKTFINETISISKNGAITRAERDYFKKVLNFFSSEYYEIYITDAFTRMKLVGVTIDHGNFKGKVFKKGNRPNLS